MLTHRLDSKLSSVICHLYLPLGRYTKGTVLFVYLVASTQMRRYYLASCHSLFVFIIFRSLIDLELPNP